MRIAGIMKSSLIDFPGTISAVLFLPGCNFDCFYCHNRLLLEKGSPMLDYDEVMHFLEKRSSVLEGVVITGGEPTGHADLIPFLKDIREMGYRLKLDTNGSRPCVVRDVLDTGLCSYFAVDYKAPSARYSEIAGTGSEAKPVLESIGLLLESGVDFEVRTTVAPGLSVEDLLVIAQELPVLSRYRLNTYRIPETYNPEDYSRVHSPALSRAELLAAAPEIKKLQPGLLI